jgi:ABC-type antimicrobial peptide transport system permease subunit
VYEEFGEETEQSRLVVYVPYARIAPRTTAVMIRTAGGPDAAMNTIRRLLRERFPGFPAYDLRTMDQVRTYTTWEQRIFGQVMAGFAMVAVLLAWIGVYGLVAYSVARRTREIGVRVALGASRPVVLRMVLGDIGVLALAGLGSGAMLGAALSRALAGLVYGVDPGDPRWLIAAVATMLVAILLAAVGPARGATRIAPAVALRFE